MLCPYRPACPGCGLAELPYDEQLEHKKNRLNAALSRYAGMPTAPTVLPALYTEAYRHRLKLPVQRRENEFVAGLYDPVSSELHATPGCLVLEPRLRAALAQLLTGFSARDATLHSVDLRISSLNGHLQLVLNTEDGELVGGARAARALMRRVPGLVSVAVSRRAPDGRRVMGQRPRVIAGEPALEEGIGESRYQLHPGAFFQADPRNASQLHAVIHHLVGSAQTVLDLYAGVGAYARLLAPGRRRVLAVEEVPEAAAAAAWGAPPGLEVQNTPVEALDWDECFDVVILNPARRGSDPRTLAQLSRVTDRVIYVSCGPESFARDLDILGAYGFELTELCALDLFPQTPEVEAVGHLVRVRPGARPSRPGPGRRSPWTDPHGWSGASGAPRALLTLVIGDTGDSGRLPGARFRRLARLAGHSLLQVTLDAAGEGGDAAAPPAGRGARHAHGRGRPQERSRDGGFVRGDEVALGALVALGRAGHPVAGHDPRTRAWFAERAGLIRPFVEVLRVKEAPALPAANAAGPRLHGDLVHAVLALGLGEAAFTALARSLSPSVDRRAAAQHPGGKER